jgi:hypothetical protein
MISKDEVMETFAMLHKAREEAYQAAKAESEAKHLLRVAEHVTLNSGQIDGKNEKQRDAQLASLTEVQTLDYQEAQDTCDKAELFLEQAKDRVKCAALIIELMKIGREA